MRPLTECLLSIKPRVPVLSREMSTTRSLVCVRARAARPAACCLRACRPPNARASTLPNTHPLAGGRPACFSFTPAVLSTARNPRATPHSALQQTPSSCASPAPCSELSAKRMHTCTINRPASTGVAGRRGSWQATEALAVGAGWTGHRWRFEFRAAALQALRMPPAGQTLTPWHLPGTPSAGRSPQSCPTAPAALRRARGRAGRGGGRRGQRLGAGPGQR